MPRSSATWKRPPKPPPDFPTGASDPAETRIREKQAAGDGGLFYPIKIPLKPDFLAALKSGPQKRPQKRMVMPKLAVAVMPRVLSCCLVSTRS